ncbi:copper amine oxidase N-terminal domain-containing protein [Brevibacillus migulae]|uniref:copper amine oxidase N-terminal domain-containing protein n=1 Tax=Brevibacillus migulae TaxID=1644114 RepID=UPI00106EDB16|nr:copper amine oxidase N-terminal domain-containing protein [Brevibacillus migulae]
MKKMIMSVVSIVMALTLVSGVFADEFYVKGLTVKVDNKVITFPDGEAYYNLRNYRVMVPVRFVSEALGAKVEWIENTKTVKMTRQNSTIELKIGSNKALVNGETFTFNAPAVIEESRTYVPIRFVSETFGAKVDWSEKDRTVSITNGQGVQPIKDAIGANIPISSKDPYAIAFHKSLKIKNGVITGTVPKPKGKNMLVSLDIWLKDGNSKVLENGGSFSYRVRDVENIILWVFDRTGKGTTHAQVSYDMPFLVPKVK